MLRQCRHRGQPYRLDLGDLVQHQPQELLRSLLDEVLQNLFLCHPGERHLGVVHRFRLDEGHPDELGLRLRHLDEGHPDEPCDPCPGLVRMGCCLDEPSDVEYPCPGSKRKDCCQVAGYPTAEPVPQVRQGPLGLEPQRVGLHLVQPVQLELVQ